jgi:hypothetical protein
MNTPSGDQVGSTRRWRGGDQRLAAGGHDLICPSRMNRICLPSGTSAATTGRWLHGQLDWCAAGNILARMWPGRRFAVQSTWLS